MENNQQLLEKFSLKKASLESEIHEACSNNNAEKVTILLKGKAREIDAYQLDRDGSLLIAIAKENVKIVGELLKIGCNPNVTDGMKNHALVIASLKGNMQIINLLLHYGANIGEALINAIWSGNANRVEKILEFGVNLNKVEDTIGQSALHIAIERKNLQIVKLLLQHNADPNLIDKLWKSPLHIAVKNGHIGIIKELLKHGAEVDGKDGVKMTPLMSALDGKKFEIATWGKYQSLLLSRSNCTSRSIFHWKIRNN